MKVEPLEIVAPVKKLALTLSMTPPFVVVNVPPDDRAAEKLNEGTRAAGNEIAGVVLVLPLRVVSPISRSAPFVASIVPSLLVAVPSTSATFWSASMVPPA